MTQGHPGKGHGHWDVPFRKLTSNTCVICSVWLSGNWFQSIYGSVSCICGICAVIKHAVSSRSAVRAGCPYSQPIMVGIPPSRAPSSHRLLWHFRPECGYLSCHGFGLISICCQSVPAENSCKHVQCALKPLCILRSHHASIYDTSLVDHPPSVQDSPSPRCQQSN